MSDGLLFLPGDNMKHRHKWLQPPEGTRLPLSTSLDEWFHQLNQFKDRSLLDHTKRPYWEGEGGPQVNKYDMTSRKPDGSAGHYDWCRRRGGEALIACQSYPASSGHNIVVQAYCHFTEGVDHVSNLHPSVTSYLKYWNINRVIVGHKPIGCVPLIVKYDMNEPDGKPGAWSGYQNELKHYMQPASSSSSSSPWQSHDFLEVICCDTSFSDPSAPDKRGTVAFSLNLKFHAPGNSPPTTANVSSNDAVCEVSMSGTFHHSEVIHGSFHHIRVGKRTEDGWWVVLWQDELHRFLLCRTKGRSVNTRWVHENDIHQEFHEK